MKFILRLLLSISAAALFCRQSFADGVIVRVKDPSQIVDLLNDFPFLIGFEQAGHSPFVRFEVGNDFVDGLTAVLEDDCRIVWAEDEDQFSIRRKYSSHGSSVAAIFDRDLTFESNSEIWKQISFTPQSSRSYSIKVGIVDTGVSMLQPSILSNVVAQASFVSGFQTVDDGPADLDTNFNGVFDEGAGHGTMVAGLILQVAPASQLVIAKSADSDGVGTSWSVIQGIVFCVENGTKVINLSLGSEDQLAGFSGFLEWVEESETVIVSPIGNNGANLSLYPAGYSKVICVVGVLPDNTKAPFSNWSSVALVAAPASGIKSSWYDGGSAVWSGTSLSAPFVTACLAAALSSCPNRTAEEIRMAVKNSGRDINDLNPLYQGQIGRLLDYTNLVKFLRK